jgi:hypothetical protein
MNEKNQKRDWIKQAGLLTEDWNQGFYVQNIVYTTAQI